MRTEAWIRTQKRRVRKKYKKAGGKYLSPREIRKFKNGLFLKSLIKAINNLNKGFQEVTAVISEAVKAISEAYREGRLDGLTVPSLPELDDYEAEEEEAEDSEDEQKE